MHTHGFEWFGITRCDRKPVDESDRRYLAVGHRNRTT